jgi:hypothetical protein
MTTTAASTLNAKSREYDPLQIVDLAVKRIMQCNDDRRTRHLAAVQKSLDAAATGKGTFGPSLHEPYRDGAGVTDKAKAADAESNEDLDWPTVAEFLNSQR